MRRTHYCPVKNELLYVLLGKLESSDRGEQDYVFQYCSGIFGELSKKPTSRLEKTIINGLTAGDVRFKNLVENNLFWLGKEWNDPFKEAIESFEEQPLPFDPEYDDADVPF